MSGETQDTQCTAHDIEGLRCYLSAPHPTRPHESFDGSNHWQWSVDHGPEPIRSTSEEPK